MKSLKAKKYTIIKRKSFGKHLMEKELTGEIYTEIINNIILMKRMNQTLKLPKM